MVKKEIELLTGPPEFERYKAEVRFPSNINGEIKNKALDKIRLVKNAELSDDMTESEALSNVENTGEVLEEVQNSLIDFAVKYMEKVDDGESVKKENLTPEAYDVILSQYADSLKGVKVGKN